MFHKKSLNNQKRYVLVNGSKLMPIKMKFQFKADSAQIWTKIEFALKY